MFSLVRTVVLFIGIEGSGHHLLETVLRHANVTVHEYTPNVVIAHNHFVKSYLEWYDAQEEPYIVHGQDSFPEGRPLKEIQHPHLTGFLHMNETGAIDLRLLVLHRNPVDAVCSAIRRFNADAIDSARVASDTLYMLDAVLKSSVHTTVCFEQAVVNPRSLFAPLAQTLAGIVNIKALRKALSLVKIRHPHSYGNTNCSHHTFLTHMLKGNQAQRPCPQK